jgi:hypothetical protein
MKAIQVGKYGISGVIVLALLVVYAIITDDDVLLQQVVDTVIEETLAPDIDNVVEGQEITIRIANDGDIIRHGGEMDLLGDIDFVGRIGDEIDFKRINGVWVEVGRSLAD